jgi:hypothetical protein
MTKSQTLSGPVKLRCFAFHLLRPEHAHIDRFPSRTLSAPKARDPPAGSTQIIDVWDPPRLLWHEFPAMKVASEAGIAPIEVKRAERSAGASVRCARLRASRRFAVTSSF